MKTFSFTLSSVCVYFIYGTDASDNIPREVNIVTNDTEMPDEELV